MVKHRLFCIIFLSLFKFSAYSQQFNENFYRSNLETKIYPIDSEAEAVVLFESTKLEIETKRVSTTEVNYMETRKIHKIIRILKSNAYNLANVKVYFPFDNKKYYLYNLTGVTYNLDGTKVIKTELPKGDYFKNIVEKDVYELVFSLPAVKEGSIIEYTYSVVMPLGILLPNWNIQEHYPKLISEFEIIYPYNFEFSIISHTEDSMKEFFNRDSAIYSKNNFNHVMSTSVNQVLNGGTFWIKRNIPALKEEPYILNLEKYYERLEFKITGIRTSNGYNKFNNTWSNINENLWKSKLYLKSIRAANNFLNNEQIDALKNNNGNSLDLAKAIFKFVRANFNLISDGSLRSKKSFSDIYDNGEGTNEEINLMLIAILNYFDLDASPVLISTTNNIPLNPNLPILNNSNYMACCLKIDSEKIYLDASDKFNVFGTLPPFCYNGFAWILGKEGEGVDLYPSMLTDKNISSVVIKFENDTIGNVAYTKKLGIITSNYLRKKWAKNTKEKQKYIDEHIRELSDNISLKQPTIEYESNPDTNLLIKYVGTMKLDKNISVFYLNSSFVKTFEDNPFKAAKRKLPIEFPYKMENNYYLNIKLPAQLKPELISKPIGFTYENDDIVYKKIMNYESGLGVLTISNKLLLNTTSYSSLDYPTIREFFENVITTENEILTINKVR